MRSLSSVFVNSFSFVVVENLTRCGHFCISIIYGISHMKITTPEHNIFMSLNSHMKEIALVIAFTSTQLYLQYLEVYWTCLLTSLLT